MCNLTLQRHHWLTASHPLSWLSLQLTPFLCFTTAVPEFCTLIYPPHLALMQLVRLESKLWSSRATHGFANGENKEATALWQGKRHAEGSMLHEYLKNTCIFQHHSPSPSQDTTGHISPNTVTALPCASRKKKTSEKMNSGKVCAVHNFRISCCTCTVMCGKGDKQPAFTW